jgi:putative nucleotidyltransferase with HDIG domain
MQRTLQRKISQKNTYPTNRNQAPSVSLPVYHRELIDTLSRILGLRDPALQTHSLRVANFATRLAQGLGCSGEQIQLIRDGSLLHDIGKLGVSQELLSKPARLTVQQYELIKMHPTLGAALLQQCPEYHAVIPIVLHHHEFFNGQGYPDRIAGSQIELEARIVSVADAVDVMMSNRPYCRAFPLTQTIAELKRCAGTQFDPLIVETAIPMLLERKHENSHYSSGLLAPIMTVEQSSFMEISNERENEA